MFYFLWAYLNKKIKMQKIKKSIQSFFEICVFEIWDG